MTKIDKAPSMPFYGNDFFSSVGVARLSLAHHGLYLRLLWWQWEEGAIPDDVDEVINVIGKPAEVKRLWPDVLRFFPVTDDGRRQNLRLEDHRKRMANLRAKRQQAANKRSIKSVTRTDANVVSPIDGDDDGENLSWDLLMNQWRERIGEPALSAILADYGDKPKSYIEKCVQTAERKRDAERKRGIDPILSVGAPPVLPAKDQLRAMRDEFCNKHGIRPSELHVQKRADWDRHFELDFGFSPEDFIDATEDQCAVWLADLGVTA